MRAVVEALCTQNHLVKLQLLNASKRLQCTAIVSVHALLLCHQRKKFKRREISLNRV